MANVEPIEANNQQSISDDQELAKVLAGVSNLQADDQVADEPVVTTPVPTPAADEPTEDSTSTPEVAATTDEPAVSDAPSPAPVAPTPSAGGALDGIKQEALSELRPLVDKLDVSPEEKFDTYLLLLRSTDDRELIAPAHDAAKNIPDEARRAQALLDIIKEIDFLSGASTQQ